MSNNAPRATAAESWRLLRAGSQVGGGLEIPTIPTDVLTDVGPVRHAIGPNGEARLLLPLENLHSPKNLQGGAGLSVNVSSFSYKGRRHNFLDLICLSTDLETVFGEVVDEMAMRIQRGADCLNAARSTIADFRSLLDRARNTKIDKRKIAGLIAELLILNRLLDRSPSAWRAWTGPTGQRHDFRSGATALEVKASQRPDATAIALSGLEQLAAPRGGTLHLLHVVLEPVARGMLSVSALVRSAKTKAGDPDGLRELLAAVGYSDMSFDKWDRHRFQVDSEQLYEVRRGFPRLTSAMLATGRVSRGVHEVGYKVDLSAAEPFLCEAAEFASVEERLCS